MFARRNQENLVHARQNIAGGKPVTEGVKDYNPKTPGDAITPVPRNRAPLGAKTSNVKQTTFKTPAPLAGVVGLPKTQRRSASARKPKLKIQPDSLQAESLTKEDVEEEPDIEYCPPKIIPLEDTSDTELFPEGVKFPQLTGENVMRGWHQLHLDEIGDDGLSRRERQFKERDESVDAYCDRAILESLEATTDPEDLTSEFLAMKKAAVGREAAVNQFPNGRLARTNVDPQKKKPLKQATQTLSARSAASALSARPIPSFAAPTAAAKAKQSAALEPVKRNVTNLASRSTIGYSNGKKVITTLRKDGVSTAKPKKAEPAGAAFGVDSEEQKEILRKLTSRTEDKEDDSPLFPESDNFNTWFEQQMGGFRLSMPEDEPEDT